MREDQVLAAVMTDKATVEIPSPADGTVTALGVEAGTVLAVGSELVRLDVGGAADAAPEPLADGPAVPAVPPPPRPPERSPEPSSPTASP